MLMSMVGDSIQMVNHAPTSFHANRVRVNLTVFAYVLTWISQRSFVWFIQDGKMMSLLLSRRQDTFLILGLSSSSVFGTAKDETGS